MRSVHYYKLIVTDPISRGHLDHKTIEQLQPGECIAAMQIIRSRDLKHEYWYSIVEIADFSGDSPPSTLKHDSERINLNWLFEDSIRSKQ